MTHYTKHKDEILVELSLLGDQTAYQELVERHERAVLGTAYKVTENRYSAQDASQDAFVSAWINLDRLKSRDKFGAWVCSIAKNKARNLVVHYTNTIPDISLDVLKISSMIEDEEEQSPDIQAISNLTVDEEKAELHNAVEALGEKIREAIKLHYFEGLSIAEISSRLSISSGTVKWRLSEGRKQLRKEYGIMEKTYDDKESVLQRVMRQVEQLKLWHIKDNLEGFEADYRKVLEAVESLDESNEKQYALSDVLKLGYWWCPGERNDEVFARMKEAALKSHNDEVMQTIAAIEHDKYSGEEKIEFIKNVQIPFMLEEGFIKTAAYCYFWYGCCLRDIDKYDEAIAAYNKVLELLSPCDVYYANALAAIDVETKVNTLSLDQTKCGVGAQGEVYKYIDGKLYLWEQPGYNRGFHGELNASLFWNCARFRELIYDPGMEPGDVLTSREGNTLTYKEKGVTVITPAGKFENCQVYVFEGDKYRLTYCETVFCPGVGIVWQKVTRFNETNVWELEKYSVTGKDELVPLRTGNKWSYTTKSAEGTVCEIENTFEVTFANSDGATVKSYEFVYFKGYDTNTWQGNMLSARNGYVKVNEDKSEHLIDVSTQIARAEEFVSTKREKLHTDIASEVMKRIFDTDPEFNPDYSEKGRWNFFEFYTVYEDKGKIVIDNDYKYGFEWKDMGYCGNEGWKVLYTFLYDILADAAGCVWSDKWVVGYHEERKTSIWRTECQLVFDVLENESIVTKAGKFENCRHISFTIAGRDGGYNYRMGKMDYWFAPEVGIVKFSRPYGKDNTLDCIWELTDYRGKADGYFPVADGLFRRYEPTELGNGWHGSVEYTFDSDENGTLIFRNSYGTQDRENYEADMAAINNK